MNLGITGRDSSAVDMLPPLPSKSLEEIIGPRHWQPHRASRWLTDVRSPTRKGDAKPLPARERILLEHPGSGVGKPHTDDVQKSTPGRRWWL
jgi:hypothetical protein